MSRYFSLQLILYLACSLVFYLQLFLKNGLALEWPLMDMGPFVRVVLDPQFLLSDSYAQNAFKNSPRVIYGQLLTLGHDIFGMDWFQSISFLKLIFVFFVPLSIFRFLKFSIECKSEVRLAQLQIVGIWVVTLIVIILQEQTRRYFSIAWWAPIEAQPIPGAVSMFLIFASCGLRAAIRSPVWFFAVLVHPVVGALTVAFVNILEFSTVRRFVRNSIEVAAAFIIVAFVFRSDVSLSSEKFLEAYVYNTTLQHYSFAHFGSLAPWPWWITFLYVLLIFGLLISYTARRSPQGSTDLRILSLILCYLVCPFAQGLLIDIMGLKIGAILTPIRFSGFGFWICVILFIRLIIRSGQANPVLASNDKSNWLAMLGAVLVFSLVPTLPSQSFVKDSVFKANPEYWSFISSSAPDSVFLIPPNYSIPELNLAGERASFRMMNIPFNEAFFDEYMSRLEGSRGGFKALTATPGGSLQSKEISFYNGLSPLDFCKLGSVYRLDFVVREASGDYFSTCSHVMRNGTISIYRRSDLCDCGNISK